MTALTKTVSGLVGNYKNSDFYQFTVNGTKTVDFDVNSVDGAPTLYIYNSSGTLLYSNSSYFSSSTTADAELEEVLASGTYYARVASTNDTHYTLSISTGTPTVGNGSSDAGGNSLAGATALGTLGTTPYVITDYVGGSDGMDYYSFNVSSISRLNVSVEGLQDNINGYLLNASGQTITSFSGSATSGITFSSILPPLTAGTYYFEITDSNTRSGTGYNLRLSATAIPDLAGNTIATARTVGTLSSTVQSFTDQVNPSDTDDYYSFQVGSTSRVSLLLSGLSNTAYLNLYDAAGNVIGYGTTGTALSNGSYIVNLPPLQVGTYYARVSSASDQTSYTLSLSAQVIPDLAGSTSATAYALNPTTTPAMVSDFVGDVDPTDDYSIVLASAATLDLRLTAGSTTTPADASLQLVTSSGSSIASSSATTTSDGLITVSLAPGTYYADVTELYGYNTPYTLTYSTGTPSVGSASYDGAGSTLATARNIGTLTPTTMSYADFVGSSDTDDIYQFTLASTATVQIDETGTVTGDSLYLLDVSGKTLAQTSGYQTQDISILQQLASGTYFLQVHGTNNTGYNLAFTGTPIPDIAGNSIANADNLGVLDKVGTTVSDFVGSVDPSDYYQFTLTAATTMRAVVSGLSYSSNNFYLLDVSGNQIASTSGGYGGDASLNWTLAAGTYFYEVTGNSTTNYSLTITPTRVFDQGGAALSSATNLSVLGTASISDFTGDAKSDLLLQNTNGTIVVETQANIAITGGVVIGNPGATWHVVGSGDFDGDSNTDILLQNDNSTIVDYLMNGTTVTAGYALGTPGAGWHVRGTGDLNADGKADVVLQNDNGGIVVWNTNGSSVTSSAYITNPGVGWTVEGVADFKCATVGPTFWSRTPTAPLSIT